MCVKGSPVCARVQIMSIMCICPMHAINAWCLASWFDRESLELGAWTIFLSLREGHGCLSSFPVSCSRLALSFSPAHNLTKVGHFILTLIRFLMKDAGAI